jgi:hypothetical protein
MRLGSGWAAMTRMGPNDVSCVVWAHGTFFIYSRLCLLLLTLFFTFLDFIYKPHHVNASKHILQHSRGPRHVTNEKWYGNAVHHHLEHTTTINRARYASASRAPAFHVCFFCFLFFFNLPMVYFYFYFLGLRVLYQYQQKGLETRMRLKP